MLLSSIVAAILSSDIIIQLTSASSNCRPIPSEYFQWLNPDGSLVLPTSYDITLPSGSLDCNEGWQILQQSKSCQFCATTSTLVCNSPQAYRPPDPTSLPATNLSLYILSGPGLYFIPPRVFAELSIHRLIIENTNLTYVGPEVFSGVSSIKSVSLRNNILTELNHLGSLFEPLSSLKILNLEYNAFKSLLSYKSAGLKKLEYFSLKGNSFSTLDMFFLQNSSLKFLDISSTKFTGNLKELEESGFSYLPTSLTTLDMSNSIITERAIEKILKLLEKKNITTLNAGCLQPSPRIFVALNTLWNSLQFLSLQGTDIGYGFAFNHNKTTNLKPFVHLTELNLKGCSIDNLNYLDFRIFPNLKILSLAENSFSNLDLSVFFNLPSLNYLDLQSNYITTTSYDYNSTLQNLQIMDLSFTNLIYLTDEATQNLTYSFPNLQKISLCQAEVYPNLITSMQTLQKLNYLDLSATLSLSRYEDLLPELGNLFLSLASSLTEIYFTRNDFKAPNDVKLFSSLQSLRTLDLSNNLIRDLTQDMLGLSVVTLNLSQNLITTWYSPIINQQSHIKFLDLSNNQVTYVSDSMVHDFYRLEWLDLANNPLLCHNKVVAMVCADVKNETHNLTMVSWQKYKCYDIVSNNYRLFSEPKECDDYYEELSTTRKRLSGDVSTVETPYELSPSPAEPKTILQRSLYPSIGIVLLAMTAAVVSCVVYFKWWSIKCYVHRYLTLRRAHLLRKEGPLLAKPDIHYDVFVSYSDIDRSWILDQLIPNMEADGDISLCFHERDFQVGLSILENIVECMDRSHSILLVVSSGFVRSKWCQFEMHLAQYRLIETVRNQLVLVLLEDIPRKARPQVLHHLMMTKTYIVWPTDVNKEDATELFWKRLKRALKPNYNYIFGV